MLSFVWDEIHFSHSWKFFTFGVRSRCPFHSFSRGVYVQKIARCAVNCSSCRNAMFALSNPFRRATRFDSDISPDIVAHPTSIRWWRPSSAFTRRAFRAGQCEDRIEVGRISERTVRYGTTETRRTPMCSMGSKKRAGKLRIKLWKQEASILRREKIDGIFSCSAQ